MLKKLFLKLLAKLLPSPVPRSSGALGECNAENIQDDPQQQPWWLDKLCYTIDVRDQIMPAKEP